MGDGAGPVLLVLAGRPGTGKTTLARRLARTMRAAVLRVDAIETAIVRSGTAGRPLGPVGYVIAHDLARANLEVGTPVVVDAVNPVPEARAGWRGLAAATGARLVVVETVLADRDEHRRRVTTRRPDLVGQRLPTWDEVDGGEYVGWDEQRDGPRTAVDTGDLQRAHDCVVALLDG